MVAHAAGGCGSFRGRPLRFGGSQASHRRSPSLRMERATPPHAGQVQRGRCGGLSPRAARCARAWMAWRLGMESGLDSDVFAFILVRPFLRRRFGLLLGGVCDAVVQRLPNVVVVRALGFPFTEVADDAVLIRLAGGGGVVWDAHDGEWLVLSSPSVATPPSYPTPAFRQRLSATFFLFLSRPPTPHPPNRPHGRIPTCQRAPPKGEPHVRTLDFPSTVPTCNPNVRTLARWARCVSVPTFARWLRTFARWDFRTHRS